MELNKLNSILDTISTYTKQLSESNEHNHNLLKKLETQISSLGKQGKKILEKMALHYQ